MSDNIPFDIQMEIIKRVYDVKSLIRFRSVSKPWKSLIDSSQFIKGYRARHTQPRSLIVRHYYSIVRKRRAISCICLVEDDNQILELAPSLVSPLLGQYSSSCVVGTCHGLLCFYGYNKFYHRRMLVIWNPSIGKSCGIVVPRDPTIVFGFGVCPVTRDPTVVKILQAPWHVEVFTLSSGVWNVIPSGNFPSRQLIRLDMSMQVVIDRFIYWGAREETFTDDDESTTIHIVVSFDLITKEFKVVDLPDSLTNGLFSRVSVFKLRESLVVIEEGVHCGVWVMEHDSSFRKLFTIGTPVDKILGFRKNGETIFESRKEYTVLTILYVYDPCSQQIKNLRISGEGGSFFMGSYKESLLLLDHPDLHIYSNNN